MGSTWGWALGARGPLGLLGTWAAGGPLGPLATRGAEVYRTWRGKGNRGLGALCYPLAMPRRPAVSLAVRLDRGLIAPLGVAHGAVFAPACGGSKALGAGNLRHVPCKVAAQKTALGR